MNYQIVKNRIVLDQFISWLPDLTEDETYYISLFARKKYCPEVPYLKTDKCQLKRVTAKKEFIIDKLLQMECEVGTYKQRDVVVPQEALAVYITPNPRSFEKAAIQSLKKLADLVTKKYGGYNPHQEVMSEIQKAKSRTVFFDLDFDNVDLEDVLLYLNNKINDNCLSIIHTRGGYHVLIEIEKIAEEYKRSWYKNIVKDGVVDNSGDTLIPIPGCYQGGFVPFFDRSSR
jgi:hypothetical protein